MKLRPSCLIGAAIGSVGTGLYLGSPIHAILFGFVFGAITSHIIIGLLGRLK
jgi:hypothetical protein